eukprot:1348652-Amorphochlora_amoeboformis.AAC.2
MGQEASVDAQQKQSKGIPARPPGNPPPSSKDLIFLSQPKNQNVSDSRTSAMTEDSVFRESQLIDVKFMEGNNRNSPTEKIYSNMNSETKLFAFFPLPSVHAPDVTNTAYE